MMNLVRIRAVWFCTLLALAGCSCDHTKVLNAVPKIVVTPPSLDFGTVPVGAVSELQLSISNAGRVGLNVGTLTFVPMDPRLSNPSILVNDCTGTNRNATAPSTIGAGECATLTVRFTASSAGPLDPAQKLVIASNDVTKPEVNVPITGTAIAAPLIQVCVLDPTGVFQMSQCTNFTTTPGTIPTLSFGTVQVGAPVVRKLRIISIGSAPLTVSSVTLSTASMDLSLPNLPTLPVTLAPMLVADVQVSLNVTNNGALTGKVVILSDSTGHTEVDIPITANESDSPPTIHFTSPALTTNTPPLAKVTGVSSAAVIVTSAVALQSVVITFDNNMPIGSWAPPTAGLTTFQKPVDWVATLGVGAHTLNATVTDINGLTGTDTRAVEVDMGKCTSDANCPSGQRCCGQDGTCNPIVAEGANCDCDHPCPMDEGCFPGVCAASPQQCRKGCFWGANTPAPYGTPPAACPDQNGLPAYCEELPPSQQTTQNQGGACAVGDTCSITAQDCPAFPLDRSKPVSATNPLVEYNCVPVSPSVNGCIPAGKLPPGGQNCNGSLQADVAGSVCGTQPANCPKGYQCITWVDGADQALGPSTCLGLCPNPSPDPNVGGTGGCPPGYGCLAPFGLGMVFFNTGTCCARNGTTCTNNTECCGINCEGGHCCAPQFSACNSNSDCCRGSSCQGGVCF